MPVLDILRRAVNEARTRDPQLGKLMLYQLSYYRNVGLRAERVSAKFVGKVKIFFLMHKPMNINFFIDKQECKLCRGLVNAMNLE